MLACVVVCLYGKRRSRILTTTKPLGAPTYPVRNLTMISAAIRKPSLTTSTSTIAAAARQIFAQWQFGKRLARPSNERATRGLACRAIRRPWSAFRKRIERERGLP